MAEHATGPPNEHLNSIPSVPHLPRGCDVPAISFTSALPLVPLVHNNRNEIATFPSRKLTKSLIKVNELKVL